MTENHNRSSAGSADLIQFAAHMARLLYNDATLDDCTEEQKRAWLSAAKALMTIYDIRTRDAAQPAAECLNELDRLAFELEEWIRQPDWSEKFSLGDMTKWMNERPTSLVWKLRALASQPSPAATVEARDAVDVLGETHDHCDAPRPQCSAGNETELLATLVYEAMRFAIWAAGQGMMPDEGEPALGPEDFLYEYSCALEIDDWEGLAEVARDHIRAVPQQVVVTDIMCKAAINADLEDRIQGCSYKERHVIYDTWLPPPSQDIWTLPVGSAQDYQAFQEQCKIERMRKVLEAALALSRPLSKCDGADDLEHLDGMLDDRERG